MEKLTLSPRLGLIAGLVEQGSVVADVGTDHGYVPVWLLQNGIVTHAVATDIHAGPLARAKQIAANYGLLQSIRLVLCDGLQGVSPHEVDTVVIAGMGGETMISILEAAPWTRTDTRLILQPQSKQPELRAWLYDHGYRITGEHLVWDAGKLYAVLTAQSGTESMPDTAALYAGEAKLHSNKQLLHSYLEREGQKLAGLAEKLANSKREEDVRRRAEYIDAAAGMQRMLDELKEAEYDQTW